MNSKLLVVQGRPQGKSLLFPPGEYIFGRGAECHIRPNSDWVSRQHCLIRVLGEGRMTVCDLGSRNGTLVNGLRVTGETLLKHGDQLSVGPLVFEVCFEEGSSLRKVNAPPATHETAKILLDTAEQLNPIEGLSPSTPLSPTDGTRSQVNLPPDVKAS